MYCSRCGTQVPDDSVFCHECGARVASAEAQEEQPTAPVGPAPPPRTAETARHATEGPPPGVAGTAPARAGHTAIGVAVIVGAGLAILGCLLTWADLALVKMNGFDVGWLTDPEEGLGSDGVLVLVVGLAAGGLGLYYFYGRNALAGVAIVALGIGATAIAGYNLAKIVQDANAFCDENYISDCNAIDAVGEGIYVVIVGGAITAIAGLAALARISTQPSRR
jgi:hypothetical protein